MKFSIRGALFFTTFVALWLGAATTGHEILLSIAVWISIWSVFLSLPLAIWDSSDERRPFWAGFFAVGLANILIFGYTLMPSSVANYPSPGFFQTWTPASVPPTSPTASGFYSNYGVQGTFVPTFPVPTAPTSTPTQSNSAAIFYSLQLALAIAVPPFAGGTIVNLSARSKKDSKE